MSAAGVIYNAGVQESNASPHRDYGDGASGYQLKSTGTVALSVRQLLVEGQAYQIRGVTFSYARLGDERTQAQLNAAYIGATTLTAMLRQMRMAGINTVRTYNPPERDVLDAFAAKGIKVIVGFPNYDDRAQPMADISHGTYRDYIMANKDHPAVLMWEFGNEYNYHPEWFGGDINNWYTALESAATTAHLTDAAHPVSTAHGELPSAAAVAACPSVDVWGMNVYRWTNPSAIFAQWDAISGKPMYLSETGGDAYNNAAGREDETAQANAAEAIWLKVDPNCTIHDAGKNCLGLTYFTWIDEWWKAGSSATHDAGGSANGGVPYDGYANEEYWGWTRLDGAPRETLSRMKTYWGASAQAPYWKLSSSGDVRPHALMPDAPRTSNITWIVNLDGKMAD
ncbi:MAG: hypothetical protein NTX50_11555 [Candidatus Sumerlaeota bacterium]|nr:hypothetical protein [Candidatus Sumerlaeota bacterium]